MIVDIHTHAGNYAQVLDGSQQAEIDKLLRDMEEGGVDRAVVLALPTAPSTCDADNHNLRFIQALEPHPNLIPFCVVDFQDADSGRRQLRDAVAAGARGLKLHTILQDIELRDERVLAVLEEASLQGVPVLMHTGQFLGFGHKTSGHTERLGPMDLANPIGADYIASDLPDLKMVLAHFGWPWVDQAIAIMQRRENVWLDLSGWAPRHIPQTVWTQLNKRHPDRFLFGTDFPFPVGSKRWLTEFHQQVTDPAVAEAVLGGNAEQVLGVDGR